MDADPSIVVTSGSPPPGVTDLRFSDSDTGGGSPSGEETEETDYGYSSGGGSSSGEETDSSYEYVLSAAADRATRTVDFLSPSAVRRRAFATRAAACAALGLVGAAALIVSGGGGNDSANHGGALNAFLKSEVRVLREQFSVERQRKRRTSREKCLISAFPPGDGDEDLGRQMEAKLSCIGAAAMAPSELAYVHRPLVEPMGTSYSSRQAVTLESLFNVSSALEELGGEPYDPSKFRTHARTPLPAVGKCDEDGKHPSWFEPSVRRSECASASLPHFDDGRRPVFTADHCLDAFWCGLARNGPEAAAAWRERALPSLREALYTSKIGAPGGRQDDTHFEDDGSLHVVVHVQKEGSEGTPEADMGYYSKIIESIRAAAQSNVVLVAPQAGIAAPKADVKVYVHTDGDPRAVAAELGVNGSPDVFVHGPGFPLPALVRRMVESDILVASSSPLVRSAALLRDNGRVIYPLSENYPGMVALGWKMIRTVEASRRDTGESVKVMQRLVQPWRGTGVKGGKWVGLDGEFWRDMLAHGSAKTVS